MVFESCVQDGYTYGAVLKVCIHAVFIWTSQEAGNTENVCIQSMIEFFGEVIQLILAFVE